MTTQSVVRRNSGALVAMAGLVLAPQPAANDTTLMSGRDMFSTKQDVDLGQPFSCEAAAQLPVHSNSQVGNYLNELGRRLAASAPGEEDTDPCKGVNDRSISAFAFLGEGRYISRGVTEAADNESQPAGFMADEIALGALRHGTNQATAAGVTQVPLADRVGVRQGLQREGRRRPTGSSRDREPEYGILGDMTTRVVERLRQSNPELGIMRQLDHLQLFARDALSCVFTNDSLLGGGALIWLITVQQPEGLLVMVFVARDGDFRSYQGTPAQASFGPLAWAGCRESRKGPSSRSRLKANRSITVRRMI